MDLLTALAIVAGLALVALVVMLVVVVLGGDDVKPLKQVEEIKIKCPYCAVEVELDSEFSVPNSNRRGLLHCHRCGITFKLYTTKQGLSVLEEVFGTPVDPRDEK